MTIAFDAVTQISAAGDWTQAHTPVGTPRGVIVLMVQNTATDFVTSVTYGGVAMSEIAGSPLLAVSGDEDMALYGYFLGASIPTGVQDVINDTTSTPARSTVIVTVTAAADTEIDAVQTQDAVEADPSVDLATTASTNTFVVAALGSGHGGAGASHPMPPIRNSASSSRSQQRRSSRVSSAALRTRPEARSRSTGRR